jgi:membrane protein implicated in regulation of membrane protease activity
MIEYFNTHLYAFWFVAGFVLLGIELLVLGFSTGFVLFLGIAALVTGGLVWAEVIPLTWLSTIATFAISSVVVSAVLWRPFKALQENQAVPEKDNTSDLIGHEFRLGEEVTLQKPGKTRYSGIEWRVDIDKTFVGNSIDAGLLVKVVSVDAGRFYVVPA